MLVTYTGRKFDFNNITEDSIYIPDVLHSISRINRFVGHSSRAYSVGEHTFLGLIMAEKLKYTPLQKLQWFIHDFTEAYVSDCPSPLKKLLPKFIEIEAEVESAILKHLGLEPLTDVEHYLVKRIDMTMLVLEMRDLTLHDYMDFIDHHTYLSVLIDDDFKIGQMEFGDELPKILGELFDNLIKEVKNV